MKEQKNLKNQSSAFKNVYMKISGDIKASQRPDNSWNCIDVYFNSVEAQSYQSYRDELFSWKIDNDVQDQSGSF